MLSHPCILGGPQTKGDEIRIGCLTPALSRAQKRAEMRRHPCILGDPQTKGDKIRSGYQKRNEDCPGFLNRTGRLGPKRGRKCYATRAFSGVPKQGDEIRIGCLTHAFAGARKRAEMLCHPCILGGPQQR